MTFAGPFVGFGSGGTGGGVLPGTVAYSIASGSNIISISGAANSSFYDSTDDKTWVFWEGWTGLTRACYCATYNHTSGIWSREYLVGTYTLTDDIHGVPSAEMDASGFVHVIYGGHSTIATTKSAYTTTARDPSAWTNSTTFATTTFYRLVRVGSNLYWTTQKDNGGSQKLTLNLTSSISSGVPTWATPIDILSEAGYWFGFGSNPVVDGTDIHFVVNGNQSANPSTTIDLFYFVWDTVNERLYTHDKSSFTAKASLPIGISTMNSTYRVVSQGTNVGTIYPALAIESGGAVSVAYADGVSGSGSFPIKVITKASVGTSSFGSPTTIDTQAAQYVPLAFVPKSDGTLELYYNKQPGGVGVHDAYMATRSSGGSWGSGAAFHTNDGFRLSGFNRTLRAETVFYGEHDYTETNATAGGKRAFLYGSGGHVARGVQGTATTAILAAMSGLADDEKIAIDRLVYQTEQDGPFGKADVFGVFAVGTSGNALIDWASPSRVFTLNGTASPSFTAYSGFDTDGVDNYIDTTFNLSTDGVNYTQNSACMGFYTKAAAGGTAAGAGRIVSSNGATLNPRISGSDDINGLVNSSNTVAYVASVTSNGGGMFMGNRSGASAVQLYWNGTAQTITNSTASSSALVNGTFLIGSQGSTFRALTFRMFVAGGSMSAAEHAALSRAVYTHMFWANRQ